jgi:serine/threonine protein kinase
VNHKNVLRVVMMFETPHPCLLTPFLPGGSLQQRLEEQGRMDELDVLRFTLGMGEGVAYLHQTGIVHGDLKSPNVLVCEAGFMSLG